jgi:hypothetical protein
MPAFLKDPRLRANRLRSGAMPFETDLPDDEHQQRRRYAEFGGVLQIFRVRNIGPSPVAADCAVNGRGK